MNGNRAVTVLGIGNRLMMDDGIGVYVVEELARQGFPNQTWKNVSVRYEVGETDVDYCLDAIQDAAFLIVVDAVVSGKKPGTVSVVPIDKLTSMAPGFSIHDLHVLQMIQLNRIQRKEKPREGAIICIEPFKMDYHFGLSQVIAQQFSSIVNTVRTNIAKILDSYYF
jgi:hydrogenase maturation protease